MKKLLVLMLCALLALSAAACTGKPIIPPKETDMPDNLLTARPTEAQTKEPTEEPTEVPTAAPTEAPVWEGLLCVNSLDRPVNFQLLSFWNGCARSLYDPYDPVDVPAGGYGEIDYSPMSDREKRCSITATDGETNYYVYDIEHDCHDAVELRAEDDGCVFEVTRKDGVSVYPACVYASSEPEGKADEHILSVNLVMASGHEAGDRLMTGGWEYAWITYQYTELTPECAAEYPKLAAAVEADTENIYGELIFRYHSLCESVQHSTTFSGRGNLVHEAFVRRADDKAYCVLYRFAETMLSTTVLWNAGCYDSQTGKAIALDDIVADVDAFTEAVNNKLAELGSDARAAAEGWTDIHDVTHPVWTLDRSGVSVFLYDGREGVSCCMGFAEYPELFREEYRPDNEDYITYFPIGTKTYFETDGGMEELKLSTFTLDDGTHIRAEYNGEEYLFEQIVPGSSAPTYFVTHMDGREFIHVFGSSDNADSIYTIAVQNGRLYYMGEHVCEPLMTFGSSAHSVPVTKALLITDPGYFTIRYWIDAVGADFGSCPTAFGGDGLTHKLSDIFTFDTVLTLKRDIDSDIVDEEGNVIGSVTLKKGDKVTYYRADLYGTFADFITADGSIARMKLDASWANGEPSVNGVSVSELFEEVTWI